MATEKAYIIPLVIFKTVIIPNKLLENINCLISLRPDIHSNEESSNIFLIMMNVLVFTLCQFLP
jgi:hypothetical protein